jgi:cation transport ATPase
LKCSGCENTIKTKLSEITGVESVAVNQEEDAVTIHFKPGRTLQKDCTHWAILKPRKKTAFCFSLKVTPVAWWGV